MTDNDSYLTDNDSYQLALDCLRDSFEDFRAILCIKRKMQHYYKDVALLYYDIKEDWNEKEIYYKDEKGKQRLNEKIGDFDLFVMYGNYINLYVIIIGIAIQTAYVRLLQYL